jgi:adenylate cyclase
LNFFKELRRRRVIRVAVVYAIIAWLLVQVAVAVEAPLNLPQWVDTLVIVLLGLGFPIALIITWAFEVTPEGVQRAQSAEEGGMQVKPVGRLQFRTEIDTPDVPAPTAVIEAAIEPAETVVLNNSIAVLPFENMSPDPDNAYFASGIHEELLNQLAKIKDLSILARTTMSRYADSELSVPEIGRELNVGAVMEGSVRYAGKRVRITAQLIDVKTGAHLWSEAYERDLVDIFEIQSDIAVKITEAMKVEFSLAEQASISKPLTNNPEAYAHYLRALSWLSRPLPDLRPLQEDLDKAIKADPLFAMALGMQGYFYGVTAGLATAEVPLTLENQTRNAELAVKYAHRALSIDPTIAVAYVALAMVDDINRDWGQSFDHAERAYELNTNQARVIWQYAAQLPRRGKIDEAIVLMDQAIALNPMDPTMPMFSALVMRSFHRWDDATRYVQHTIALAPNAPVSYVILTGIAAWSGDRELALRMAKEAELRSQGYVIPDGYIVLLDAYTRFGLEDDAARMLAKLHELDGNRRLNDGEWARMYAVLGDADKAFEHMNRMIDNSFPSDVIRQLVFSPQYNVWDNIRDDPRFEAARQKIGLPE